MPKSIFLIEMLMKYNKMLETEIERLKALVGKNSLKLVVFFTILFLQ